MNNVDSLRALFADASNVAPSDHGLVASVLLRARRRQRRQQAIVALAVAAVALAGFGAVKATTGGPARSVHPSVIGPPSPSAGCAAGLVPAMTALVPESAITIKIYNGSGTVGLSETVGAQFRHSGFTVEPIAAADVKRPIEAVANIGYGPKTVGAAQVVRAYLLMTGPGTDANMHFSLADDSDVVTVIIGGGFRRFGAPTEVHQDLAQLGTPAAPPGTCVGGATAKPSGLVPLVGYTAPTFPYTPGWGTGSYPIAYDENGIDGYGVTGNTMGIDVPAAGGAAVIFVSHDKPVVRGSGTSVTADGRPAQLVRQVLIPLYKDDGTRGIAVYWKDKAGRWVTVAFGPSISAADAMYAVNHLSSRPVSVLGTFVPAKIPAGMHVAIAKAGLLVLRSTDGSLPEIRISAAFGTAPAGQSYQIGDDTYEIPFDTVGHVEVLASPASNHLDLAAFAAQITIVPGDVSALTGGG